MKTFTVVIAAAIIIAVGGTGSIPFLVLCPVRSEADGIRFATATVMAQTTLVAEFIRLKGIFRKGRRSSVKRKEVA